MRATLIIRDRRILADGAIIEVVIWQVPTPVPPTTHGLKYRLFYGRDGERVVGFDNERGKGDHKHVLGIESPYGFTTLAQLLDDFEAEIVAIRGEAI
ncbi:toxin-antitoxin system TumE family protein [Acidiphilium iwatense]|uniref:DUF6516 family protein n=1 Tax=Acidiphilium iwatense TaxID=768198 RepID=A0ABS9DX61_9PROT|nr:DUF6516 family protein [Acidiphilium iwatense]MCF3947333.1 DUF6516 family protein [Acidiphilium iwatense]